MRAIRVSALLAASLLTACATTPGHQLAAERDPYEKTNRSIYSFNRAIDKAAVKPATKVYRAVVLKAAQRGITNFFNNVDEPFSFINSLLQGKPSQAIRTLGRFAINTTLGVGGLADHATDMGLPEEPEDFGQTLAVWGVNSGPYLMLPFFGPSTFRDAIGFGVERVGDPYRVGLGELNLSTTESLGVTGLELADTRSYVMDTADPLLEGSADEYATVRSAFLQYRLNLIHDGAPPEEEESAPPAAPGVATQPTQPTPPEPATTPGESAPAPARGTQPAAPAATPAPEEPAVPTPEESEAAPAKPDATAPEKPTPPAPEQPKP